MTDTLIFIVLLVVTALLVFWRGGKPERYTITVMLVGTAATALANANHALGFRNVEWQLFCIDFAMLGAFILIALYADRFWPIWLSAIQCIAVAAHAARAFDAEILPIAYWWILGKLAYPMILLLCIGVERHQYRIRSGSAQPGSNNTVGSPGAEGPDLAKRDEY